MEKALSKLRVVDLKSLLTEAGIKSAAKTKADLTKAVLASPAAIEAYNKQYDAPAKADELDLLAPPEDVDWNEESAPVPEDSKAEEPIEVEPTETLEEATALAATSETSTSDTAATTATTTAQDEEEKRRQRANRFGIPLIQPTQKKTRTPAAPAPAPAKATIAKATGAKGTTAKPVDDPDKLKARAARFATAQKAAAAAPTVAGQKRAAPVENVDADELERRKKRAERFGTAPAAK